MVLKNLFGKTIHAQLTTDHLASSYGVPVIVADGKAYGPRDVLGWKIVAAGTKEREALKRAGYTSLSR